MTEPLNLNLSMAAPKEYAGLECQNEHTPLLRSYFRNRCPSLAPNRHAGVVAACPLLTDQRTLLGRGLECAPGAGQVEVSDLTGCCWVFEGRKPWPGTVHTASSSSDRSRRSSLPGRAFTRSPSGMISRTRLCASGFRSMKPALLMKTPRLPISSMYRHRAFRGRRFRIAQRLALLTMRPATTDCGFCQR